MSPEPASAAPFVPAHLPDQQRHASDRAMGRAQGYAAGFAAGARAGAEAIAAEQRRLRSAHEQADWERNRALRQGIEALERAADAVRAQTVPVLSDVTDTLRDAAFALAAAVIGSELSDAETSARSAVSRALGVPLDVGVSRLRISPADLATLTSHELLDLVPDSIELIADPSLDQGDAISEFPDGYLDARIGSALARARGALDGNTP